MKKEEIDKRSEMPIRPCMIEKSDRKNAKACTERKKDLLRGRKFKNVATD
jgi:hypothetical protein